MLPVNLLLLTGERSLTYGLAGMSFCLSNMLLLERPLDFGQRQEDPDRECCLKKFINMHFVLLRKIKTQ